MNAFEFFFSLFGLILGLAVATVISGLSDVLRERKRIPIGWLTPMLALFVLADLSSLWVNAWSGMSDIQVAYGPFVAALIVAGIYFFAASMVFPKTVNDWPSLDEYYMGHHRWVLRGVAVANLGALLIEFAAHRAWSGVLAAFVGAPITPLWWATLITLCFVPRKSVQLAGLAILLMITLYVLAAFW